MTQNELKEIMTAAQKSRNALMKKLKRYQNKQDDAGCDIVYYQLSIENDNINYCLKRLEQV